ncbi:polypyrimidine tract-binding protein homolog 3 [Tanacetum coccineum]
MASSGSDQNAEYALSKLLQMGTVAEYESEFVILANRELFRSRPTTLGEAFSFAFITEARFEDERSTIAISKPNELTSHVHVQDLEQTTQRRADEPNRILLVTIHHMIYPITVEVLYQVFSPLGYVEKVVIFQKSAEIQFSNLEELQENQEEHICYYYWENYFSILNAEEADNTKPPLAADTFAKEVVDNGNGSALIFYGTRSEVVTGLPEKF